VVGRAAAERTPITAAGGQTSTTGASITARGVVLSLRALDRILDIDATARTARVQAGVGLGDFKRAAAAEGLLFAPDPTSEDDVTIGGAIACNASGARSLRYGATRAHVVGLRVVLANGDVLDVRRPSLEKNTAGYALAQDPVDWFVGSEGTLGIVVEAELALLPRPDRVTGLAIPFRSEADALRFVVAARESPRLEPRCLEYFDGVALAIARRSQGHESWLVGAEAMVYAEETSDDGREPALDQWLALAERQGAASDDVLALESEAELRDARRFRHAVPAQMNERGASYRGTGGRKLSTDWAVPYRRLPDAIAAARALADQAGVGQAVIYGHAGSGHPHQNFIARDGAEREAVERVIEATLRHVLSLGGTVSAEHGIGKLKRRWLPLQATPAQLGVMRAVKRELDPLGLLAPGNIFE
ncbi:MAG: FAD-binding oxidoreductase, partial [Gemmatimonadota bacterium]|nr:FAD-binding oxidoreductase [Gemmatimonadota bacterium]